MKALKKALIAATVCATVISIGLGLFMWHISRPDAVWPGSLGSAVQRMGVWRSAGVSWVVIWPLTFALAFLRARALKGGRSGSMAGKSGYRPKTHLR